jgi:quercetin dioxygenase-like cupin family protein
MKSAPLFRVLPTVLFFTAIAFCHAQPVAPLSAAPVVAIYAPPKDSTVLGTTFVDFDSLKANTTAAGESRPVFDNPTVGMEKLEVHVTTLNPGMESHPIHRHPWEEILLIKEGEIEVSINGTKHHAGPGAMVLFASNDPHNARNVGATPATYYVVNFVTDLAVAAAENPSEAQQSVPGKLASTVIDTNALTQTPTPTGSRAVVVSSPTLTFLGLESHISTLNPGQQTAVDIVDSNDEFVLVRSGQIEVKVNGIASRMNAGSMLYWAPNDKRTIRNLGSTPASYQVIRVTSDKSPKAPTSAGH